MNPIVSHRSFGVTALSIIGAYQWCWVQLTNERVVLWVEAGDHKSWKRGDEQRGNSKGVLFTEQSSIDLFLGRQVMAERTPGEFYPGKHCRITHQQNNRCDL